MSNYEDATRAIARLSDAWSELVIELVSQNEPERKEALAQMRTTWGESIIEALESDIAQEIENQRQWLNCYSVSRSYGGSEEGGWYYDSGDPLFDNSDQKVLSIEVTGMDDDAIEIYKLELEARFGWSKPKRNRLGRMSANGGADFEIYLEEHPAQPFPAERPHYE